MHRHPTTADRHGSTIIELTISMVILSTVLVVVGKAMSAYTRQRQRIQSHQMALVEVGNVMEDVYTRSWTDITNDTVTGMSLSRQAERQLPGAQLSISIENGPGAPETKKITVDVRWPNKHGQLGRPVELVAWKHRTRASE